MHAWRTPTHLHGFDFVVDDDGGVHTLVQVHFLVLGHVLQVNGFRARLVLHKPPLLDQLQAGRLGGHLLLRHPRGGSSRLGADGHRQPAHNDTHVRRRVDTQQTLKTYTGAAAAVLLAFMSLVTWRRPAVRPLDWSSFFSCANTSVMWAPSPAPAPAPAALGAGLAAAGAGAGAAAEALLLAVPLNSVASPPLKFHCG